METVSNRPPRRFSFFSHAKYTTKTARLGVILSVFALVTAPFASAQETQRVIVKFKSPPSLVDRSTAVEGERAYERKRFHNEMSRKTPGKRGPHRDFRRVLNGVAIEVSPKELDDIRKLSYVDTVYPDVEVHTQLTESAPLIGATQVWNQYGVTGSGVRVAIIDTGIDYRHADFGGCFGASCKVIGGFDFVNNDNDPMDDHGHGTHVAGIVAANGALKGIAPDARLLAYKVANSSGIGYTSDIIRALEAAVDPDGDPMTDDAAQVINISLGGAGNPDTPVSLAVDTVTSRGIVVVVAAGNDGPNAQSIGTPGTSRSAITVGASDKQDQIAFFSSRGPVNWPGGSILKPDLVAPGMAICSAILPGSGLPGMACIDTQHRQLSGTSMAAPHVAGAVALLRQKHPDWSPLEIKLALRATATDLARPPTTQGYGRINALAALQLPHAPPIAAIDTSGNLAASSGDIKGWAAGAQFKEFSLYLGEGEQPQTWQLINSSFVPAEPGLLGHIDPFMLQNGLYTLRLVVRDADQLVSEDRVFTQIRYVQVLEPKNLDSIRLGATVDVQGEIPANPYFQRYAIEIGEGEMPTQWTTSGIKLVGDGLSPIKSGTLGQWDTTGLPPGTYTMRVVVTNTWGDNIVTVQKLLLDPLLRAGWPVRIPSESMPELYAKRLAPVDMLLVDANGKINTKEGPFTTSTGNVNAFSMSPGLVAPIVRDLDQDGHSEVVVLTAGLPAKLQVFGDDGQLHWSAKLGSHAVYNANLGSPTLGDLDNDGRDEIVAYVPNFTTSPFQAALYAYHGDGSSVPGFPVAVPYDFSGGGIVIADLDVDGYKEIILLNISVERTDLRALTLVNRFGAITSQWKLPARSFARWEPLNTMPVVGNFDDDPELEIVLAEPGPSAGYNWNTQIWENPGLVHVFNMDGSEVPGWPRSTAGFALGSPAIGDIDGDGKEDIVIGKFYVSSNGYDPTLGGIEVFDRHGNSLPGWPQLQGQMFFASPALGDLDGDGKLEIVVNEEYSLWVLRPDGQVMPGWPYYSNWKITHTPIIADVNGDHLPDIVGSAIVFDQMNVVAAWNAEGRVLDGFPIQIESGAYAAPTVADIDNDGNAEIVASSSFDFDFITREPKQRASLYAWNLGVSHNPSAAYWPHFLHDVSHTGRTVFADFVEESVTAPLVPTNRGSTLTVRDSTANRGVLATSPSWTQYYLSPNETIDIFQQFAIGARNVDALEPGAVSSGIATLEIPGDTETRRYHLFACANADFSTIELNRANNCRNAGELRVTAPDLRETNLSGLPNAVKRGEEISFRDSVSNDGNGPAAASVSRVYLSKDRVRGTHDIALTGVRSVPKLAPGSSSTAHSEMTVPAATPPGDYFVLVCADDTDMVKFEKNEDNNCLTTTRQLTVKK